MLEKHPREIWVALKRAVKMGMLIVGSLLAARVLGDGLGALRHGVLSQLTGEEQTDGGLDLPRGDGGSLVVVSEARSFGGNSLEDVVHEAVHDGHGLAADTGVGVHLFQHLVDVDAVRFLPPPLSFLVPRSGGLCLTGLLRSLCANLRCHSVFAANIVSENVKSAALENIYNI